jgi:chemotaxis protein MotA
VARKPTKRSGRGAVRTLDFLTLIGVTMAVGAIVGGNYLEGGRVTALMQLTAFVIVVGGTVGAVLIQTPLRDFLLALRRLGWVVATPKFQRQALLDKTLEWSRQARREGLLALEKAWATSRTR